MSQATTSNLNEPQTEAVVDELGAPPRAKSKDWMIRLISMLVVTLAWEVIGRRVSPLYLSYPSAIAQAAFRMIASGELLAALASSIRMLVLGFVTAAVIGVAAGLLIGRYRLFDAATDWLVNALYATPLVALIPLVILWFGLGDSAKLFIIILMSVFPILINTAAGVKNVPQALIDVSTAFAANERQVFLKIILPAAVPLHDDGASPWHWSRNHCHGRRRVLHGNHRPRRVDRPVWQSI
jgi:ABC-type nitrate/sulfonate/bicarbonate transport system permease component